MRVSSQVYNIYSLDFNLASGCIVYHYVNMSSYDHELTCFCQPKVKNHTIETDENSTISK